MAVGNAARFYETVGSVTAGATYSKVVWNQSAEWEGGVGSSYTVDGSGNLTLPESGNYLVLYNLSWVSDNSECIWIAKITHDSSDVVGSYSSVYAWRSSADSEANLLGNAMILGAAAGDTIAVEFKRGADDAQLGTVANESFVQVVRLPGNERAAFAYYTGTGSDGDGQTWLDEPFPTIVTETDTTVIEQEAGDNTDIELKTAGRYLVAYGARLTLTGSTRSQRILALALDATQQPCGRSHTYIKDTNNGEGAASGLAIVEATAGQMLSLQIQRGRASHDGTVTANDIGLWVMEIPSAGEMILLSDSIGDQSLSSGAQVDLNLARIEDLNVGSSYTRNSNTEIQSNTDHTALVIASAPSKREVASVSGTSAQTAIGVEIGGVEDIVGMGTSFVRGVFGAQITKDGCARVARIGRLLDGDTIKPESRTLHSSGQGDDTQEPDIGMQALNLDTLGGPSMISYVDDYLCDGGPRPILVLVVQPMNRTTLATDVSSGKPEKLYFCEKNDTVGAAAFRTGPDDSPANQRFIPRVVQFSNVRTDLMKDGAPGTIASTTVGTIKIDIQHDGRSQDSTTLEAVLSDYLWDGAHWEILLGGEDESFTDFMTLSKGIVKNVGWSGDELTLNVRSRYDSFDDAVTRNIETYAGTGDYEGGEDLKGVRKPWGRGIATNVEGQRLGHNINGLIVYQFASGITAELAAAGYTPVTDWLRVYDGGDLLTEDVHYVTSGHYATTPKDIGVITLVGSEPVYKLTADLEMAFVISGERTSRSRVVADLMEYHADDGISEGDMANKTEFHEAAPDTIGVHMGTEEFSINEVLERVLPPNGYAFQRRDGFLAFKWLTDPRSQTPAVTFEWRDIGTIERIRTAPPVWSYRNGYGRNHTIQRPNELAGGDHEHPDFGPDFAGEEFRYVQLQDPALKNYGESVEQTRAREEEVGTPTLEEWDGADWLGTGANNEARDYWDIFIEPRDTYRISIERKWFHAELGDVVELNFKVPHLDDEGVAYELSRFGFDTAGDYELEDGSGGYELEDGSGDYSLEGDTHRPFLVVGVEEDFGRNQFALTLWG